VAIFDSYLSGSLPRFARNDHKNSSIGSISSISSGNGRLPRLARLVSQWPSFLHHAALRREPTRCYY